MSLLLLSVSTEWQHPGHDRVCYSADETLCKTAPYLIILVPVVAFSIFVCVITLTSLTARLLCVFYNSCPCCRFQYGSDHACHSHKTLDRCVFNHSCPGHCFQYVRSGSTLVVIVPVSLMRLFTKLQCVFYHSCPGHCFQYLQSGSTMVLIIPVSLIRH